MLLTVGVGGGTEITAAIVIPVAVIVAAIGVGGNLVNKEWVAAGEFDKIGQAAKEFVESIKDC